MGLVIGSTRYDPTLAADGKDAFILDSKTPTGDYQGFLAGENRYAALKKINPTKAAELFARSSRIQEIVMSIFRSS